MPDRLCNCTVIRVHAWETYPCMQGWIRIKCPHTYKSCWRWSVSQFSTCVSLFSHGCTATWFLKFPDSLKWQLYPFPDQMSWQFLLIMASNFPLQPSSPPIYNDNEFIHSVKWRIDWPYRKPYACCLISRTIFCPSNMFNFCEYLYVPKNF